MKVRDTVENPNFSPFTREIVRVGEAIEKLGYKLDSENYSQCEQTYNFTNGEMRLIVMITEDD